MAAGKLPISIFLATAPLLSLAVAAGDEALPPLPSHQLELDFDIPEPPQDLSVYDHPRPLSGPHETRVRRADPNANGSRAGLDRPSVVVRVPGALTERQRRQAAALAESDPVPQYSRLPELRYSSPSNIATGYLSDRAVVSVVPMDEEMARAEAKLLADAAKRRLQAGGQPTQALRRVVLIAEVDDPLMALARLQQGKDHGRFVSGVDLDLPADVLAELERYQGQELSPETTLELVESLMMSMRQHGRQVSSVKIVDESLARGEIALMVVEPGT